MTLLTTNMDGQLSPVDRHRELARRQTGDKDPRSVNGDGEDTEDEEDEDEREDDDDEEDLNRASVDPVKAAFDEILIKIKSKELKLGLKEHRSKFFEKYKNVLWERIAENKNILHVLAYEGAPNRLLITHLAKKYPKEYAKLLLQKDETRSENNPLYAAIFKKNAKLVNYMCENKENSHTIREAIKSALGMICGERSENCLHIAIQLKLSPEVVIPLIMGSSDKAIRARDSKGFTPFHYAVEYDKCTDAQLRVVQALIDIGDSDQTLIEKGESALDQLGNKPDYYSVYRYHESTRDRYLRGKAQASSRQAEVARERPAEMRPPDNATSKPPKGHKEMDPKSEAAQKKEKEGSKEGAQQGRGEMRPPPRKDIGEPKRRESVVILPDGKEQNAQAPNGHSLGDRALAVPGTPIRERSGMSFPTTFPSTRDLSAQPRRRVEEADEQSAENIRELLQLHYLRTRSPAAAASLLYGKNPDETQISFDYDGGPLKVDPDEFRASFKHLIFDEVLQYVAFPNVRVSPMPDDLPNSFGNSPGVMGKGRSDMMFFFEWLREKKVKRIIKVIVNDMQEPAHSDEAIEFALQGFGVEVLDWQKVDLCPETMYRSSQSLREVYLQWSGNNAVLRAWSEPDGLKKLEDLTMVHLRVEQDLETSIRTNENIKTFCERLSSHPPPVNHPRALSLPAEQPEMGLKRAQTIDVTRVEKNGRNERLLTMSFSNQPGDTKQEPTLYPHRWLESMDQFADAIQNVWSWTVKQKLQQQSELQEPVEVALIDDGVDVLQHSLRGKIANGKSFDYGNKGENRMRPHWISAMGHGTVMARNIARVCPMAKIYVIRLETHYDAKDNKSRIEPRSAAEAIDAAVDRGVQIISMSWTIRQPENNSEEKKKFDSAIRRAIEAGILMFCSAGDKGVGQDNDYPSASSPGKMLRIGAAKANGNAWDWVGDINNLDFIIPGHQVAERPNDDDPKNFQMQTGSSVATALGAGLAALIISCVQLAAVHTQISQQVAHAAAIAPTAITTRDLTNVRKMANMKAAFEAIGTSRESQNKFIEVWKVFDKATKEMKPMEKEKRLGVVAALAPKFARAT